jgi:hypothetical protein
MAIETQYLKLTIEQQRNGGVVIRGNASFAERAALAKSHVQRSVVRERDVEVRDATAEGEYRKRELQLIRLQIGADDMAYWRREHQQFVDDLRMLACLDQEIAAAETEAKDQRLGNYPRVQRA